MADNLLDKASILLTPTAYNDGSMLSIKPENGDGDFDFSRGSAATRVNAQGLVENVQIISSELVSNGNFSQIGTEEVLNGNFSQEGSELVTNGDFANWTNDNPDNYLVLNQNANNYVTESNGQLRMVSDNSATIAIRPEPLNMLTAGKIYKVSVDLTFTTGTIDISGNLFNTSGTKVFYLTAPASYLQIAKVSALDVLIDNVSVKEVGQNWDLGTGWSIGDGEAVTDGTINKGISQEGILTSGKFYKISLDVNVLSGSLSSRLRFFDSNSSDTIISGITSSGTYTFYASANKTGLQLISLSDNTAEYTVTNISIKEVGQDWTLGTGWSVDQANSKAISDGTTSNLQQFSVDTSVVGKKYKISLYVSDYLSGFLSLGVGGYDYVSPTITGNGEHTRILEVTNSSSNDRLYIGSSSFNGSITNISVKEVTDDTNIPRINYEGFSYQDSLGSEEVVNGDFSNGTNNWTPNAAATLSIDNGKLKVLINGTSGYPGQFVDTIIGKTYKVTADGFIGTSSRIALYNDADGQFRNLYADGNFNFNFIATSTSTQLRLYVFDNGAYGLWDNVSIKEYLGQEVVPDSGCGSWLLEPQSTNLITHSEDFSDSSWVKKDTTIEVANITMPNGVINGYKLFANTSSTSHRMEVTPSPTATVGQNFTLSLFIKSAGSDFIQVASSTGFNSRYQNFNISTGTKASGDISDSSITDFGNGWYRISVTETTTGTSARYLIIPALSDITRNAIFQGNANEDGVYIWGAQLENLPYASSYIPTNGSIATRLADEANNSGNSSLINSTEGVLYAEIAALANDGTFRLISISDGTNSNRIFLAFSNNNNKITANITSGGVSQGSIHYTSTNLLLFHKIALKYKLNDFQLWINGIKVATDTTATMPTGLNRLNFTNGDGVQNFFHGKAKALAVFPILTDAELQSLTTQ